MMRLTTSCLVMLGGDIGSDDSSLCEVVGLALCQGDCLLDVTEGRLGPPYDSCVGQRETTTLIDDRMGSRREASFQQRQPAAVYGLVPEPACGSSASGSSWAGCMMNPVDTFHFTRT
ncbi:hypothetical protein LZ30DRAFT_685510 [Colletotrichum cereale]|nr:hypothetical protein LZ30DRAFT_685510 [Colletotrichum cereale]